MESAKDFRAEGSQAWCVWRNCLGFGEFGTQVSGTGVCHAILGRKEDAFHQNGFESGTSLLYSVGGGDMVQGSVKSGIK